MKLLQQQRGMGMMQLLLIVSVVGFCLLFAAKVVPLYAENRYVEEALRSIEAGGDRLTDMTDADIRAKLGKFYLINNVRSEGPTKNIAIDRSNNKVLVTVDYEARQNFVWDIDLLVKFQNHLDSTRVAQCCKPAMTAK
jgi:hypothetical protein